MGIKSALSVKIPPPIMATNTLSRKSKYFLFAAVSPAEAG
jgi:hypothetical protein